MTRAAGAVLALVFLIAHAAFLPASLEDIDSVNFALGVRHFDVAQHRPHPPGYPVYIGLGKAAVAAAGAVSSPASRSALEARALAWLSAIFGALALPLLYRLFTCLTVPTTDRRSVPWRTFDAGALAATAVTAACPLFWYMSARPMSDIVGLTGALAAQVCLALAWWRQRPGPDGDRRLVPEAMAASGRMIVLGALLSGFAIGFRSQTVWLTFPLLAGVLVDRIGRGVAGAVLGGAVTFGLGVAAWGIPLLAASGGLNAYMAALGSQAGEDFAGVEMLYLNPTPRAAAFALLRTFVYPWDSVPLAAVVLALAAIGAVVLLLRARRTCVAVALMSVPYLVFHLAFHDTSFVRYALPLVPMTVFLALRGVAVLGTPAVAGAAAVLAAWALSVGVPVLKAYAAEASPVSRLVAAMRDEAARGGQPGALALHQAFRRPFEAEDLPVANVLPAPPRREWEEAVKYWRTGETAPLWFIADPGRTDLALIDPQSRVDRTELDWRFQSLSTLGGMRPWNVIWYRMPPPGWFADEGWALTPETAGMARLMGKGPHLGPITAWVRRRAEHARVLVGGRNLGAAGAAATTFTMRVDGQVAATWDVAPGFFLRVVDLPAGSLAGDGPLAALTIDSTPAADGGPAAAVEQFDLQSDGVAMWGYGEGWYEAEFDPVRGPWRWTGARATILVDGARAPLTLHLAVESPRRYFDAPAHVRIAAGERTLATPTFDDGATEVRVDLPVEALTGGAVTIETDRTFVPAERSGAADRRRLGLRVRALELTPPHDARR